MKITETAHRLILASESNALISNQALAKACGLSIEHTSRLRSRLIEEEIIKPRVFLNVMALGYLDIKIFFSLAKSSPKKQEQLLSNLKRQTGVAWIGRYTGEFSMGVALYCKSPLVVSNITDSFSELSGITFSRRTILTRLQYTWLGHASQRPEKRHGLSLIPTKEITTLQERDLQILKHLGNKPFEGVRALAKALGESPSTMSRHLQRLEQARIIQGYFYACDPSVFNLETYRILLSFSTLNAKKRAAIIKWTKEQPQATFFSESIGAWDFELGFELKKSRELSPICDTLQEACGDSLRDIKIITETQEMYSNFFPF